MQNLSTTDLWSRYQKYLFFDPATHFAMDVSRVAFPESIFKDLSKKIEDAFDSMDQLESGAIANFDEKRMVGHYWLRSPELAPAPAIRDQITTSLKQIKSFAKDILEGKIKGSTDLPFESMLIIGIGGSALGPQFVANALGNPDDPIKPYFIDNTDPEGIERTLAAIPDLSKTIIAVISKSGGTPETRNGMLEVKARFDAVGLSFAKQAIAVTGEGSLLDKTAVAEKWLARFPMWDWVGGRTSELSAVGLLPAALQGFDIEDLLLGAKYMDGLTRVRDPQKNPAALLALMWHFLGGGRGAKDMVILPYRDRLELLSRYLQQLVMESLGKEKDLNGKVVNQGIAVYGNKGSTDQHAYVQQLREGLDNFFVIFIEACSEKLRTKPIEVEPGITSSDYLHGFLLGTRQALYENNRQSISISVSKIDPFNIGMLIALFERAVGFYATLINVNAYHQPGVEAGKKAAASILETQKKLIAFITDRSKQNDKGQTVAFTVEDIANGISCDPELAWKLSYHLTATGRLKVLTLESGECAFSL